MSDFITMVTRITTELRRTNLTTEAKAAINDAIREAAETHFWFNEMRGVTFPTVIGQEYYSDQNFTEIESLWITEGSGRRYLDPINNREADREADGSNQTGLPQWYSRQGESIRFGPVPSSVVTINLEGYGRLSPFPLVDDDDTNAWMTTAELYIRALAKRNLLRDVISDYGQARVFDAIAEDYKTDLVSGTSMRLGTDTLKPTRF